MHPYNNFLNRASRAELGDGSQDNRRVVSYDVQGPNKRLSSDASGVDLHNKNRVSSDGVMYVSKSSPINETLYGSKNLANDETIRRENRLKNTLSVYSNAKLKDFGYNNRQSNRETVEGFSFSDQNDSDLDFQASPIKNSSPEEYMDVHSRGNIHGDRMSLYIPHSSLQRDETNLSNSAGGEHGLHRNPYENPQMNEVERKYQDPYSRRFYENMNSGSLQVYPKDSNAGSDITAVQRSLDNIHIRNNSESSTVSSASTNSTLTPRISKDERFVRYVMNTRSGKNFESLSKKWLMENVLRWLDIHEFNDSWKETFKRNEISGNRFLELCNYDSNSIIWKQFGKYLVENESMKSVEKFIELLRYEINSEKKNEEVFSKDQNTHSRQSSMESQNLTQSSSGAAKAEYRKSTSAFHKQRLSLSSASSLSLHNINSGQAGTQRPVSYIDTSTYKPSNKDSVSSHKFFRKSKQLSYNNLPKDLSPITNYSPSDTTFYPNNSNKKSGIFSTLKKYGGDKAAEIVKQVQSSSGSKNTSSSNLKSVRNSNYSASILLLGEVTSNDNVRSASSSANSISIDKAGHDQNINTQEGAYTPNVSHTISSEKPKSKKPDLLINIESDEPDELYLPKPKSDASLSKTILISKDNVLFIPLSIFHADLSNIELVKDKIIQKLGLINVGHITFHLTDFNSTEGLAMSDKVFARRLNNDDLLKLIVYQELGSPTDTATFSTTSSDSKSFEIRGENSEKSYPETPQYLLQSSKDPKTDYLNFKEVNKLDRINELAPRLSDFRPAPQQFSLKLHLPVYKKFMKENPTRSPNAPSLLINTSELSPFVSRLSPNSNTEKEPSPSSFKIIRKEGREIDFDKRRSSPFETKASRLIPNIYSSSISDSLKSPVSATTVSTFKGEKNKQQLQYSNSITSDKEKTANIIAKRAAPPPPLDKKLSLKTFSSKSLLSRSDLASLSKSLSYSSRRSFVSTDSASPSAFKENDISFDDVPQPEYFSEDEEDFFMKPIKKPVEDSAPVDPVLKPSLANNACKDEKPPINIMDVRPPVEEVYKNLEKYFPNTNLDKPIIDDTPISPVVQVAAETSKNMPTRKPTISRTFSNANISPINRHADSGDEVIYGDNKEPELSRRRMKTIRIVANEARRKRLQRQLKTNPSQSATGNHTPDTTKDSSSLLRKNTKLWGQKVVEVTSTQIEQGFVSKLRSSKDGEYKEFAWIKGELIGRGSFGAVFLALNVTTGEMLAVKQVVVNKNSVSSSHKTTEGIDALKKEVETMKDLDHDNIVQYLGFEQKGTIYSLFLEYVAGGSISSCLRSFGSFDEPLVKFITRQVLLGLEYLHSNGILHRDLKADNLLLEIDGTCKISDFGISKKSKDIYVNNAEMSMQGTIFWMAPEVIDSIVEDKKQGYSAKVDIWSLGCVVLEMFAGKRPWSNEAVVSAIYKIGKTKLAPPIPESINQVISSEAKDFIKKCFIINTDERPTARELLQHPFMTIDSTFSFETTRLGKTIKYHSKKYSL